jgi:hypothetical protein
VWSEFIAQYYALIKTERETYGFSDVCRYIFDLLGEVSGASNQTSKRSFSMACACLLTCKDAEEVLSKLNEPNYIMSDSEPRGRETQTTFRSCLELLYGRLQNEKPWKISEDFIEELGSKFLMFKVMNSSYIGAL